jgi:hypothetical protein
MAKFRSIFKAAGKDENLLKWIDGIVPESDF